MKATGSFPKAASLCKSEEKPEPSSALDWIRAGFQFPGKPLPPPVPPKPLPPVGAPPTPDNPKPGEKGVCDDC